MQRRAKRTLPAATFYFKPVPAPAEPSPCTCPYKVNTCVTQRRLACAHPEHRYLTPDTPTECVKEVCEVSRTKAKYHGHHHHPQERAKVLAALERRLQLDGFTLAGEEVDGTLRYERAASQGR